MDIDHALPFSQEGGESSENTVPACEDCNAGKRDRVYGAVIERVGGSIGVLLHGGQFLAWLRRQVRRNDPIGDLARDEERDPLLQEPTSYKDLCAQLRMNGAHDRQVFSAAWHAWRVYHRNGKLTRAYAAAARKNLEIIKQLEQEARAEAEKRGDRYYWNSMRGGLVKVNPALEDPKKKKKSKKRRRPKKKR